MNTRNNTPISNNVTAPIDPLSLKITLKDNNDIVTSYDCVGIDYANDNKEDLLNINGGNCGISIPNLSQNFRRFSITKK